MEESQKRPSFFGWRHGVTLLCFFGFLITYAVRVNLSMAVVAMVNQTAIRSQQLKADSSNASGVCVRPTANTSVNNHQQNGGMYVWDEQTQGIILASFFYGYVITQIPGGILSTKFGGKWVFGIGTLLASLFTLLTPMAANFGAGWLILVRVLVGIAEGVTWPSSQTLFSKWAHSSEKSTLAAFALCGCNIGTLVTFLISGYLCSSSFMGGWPSLFYLFGIIGIVWFIAWALLVSSTPMEHRFIGAVEKAYLSESAVEGKPLDLRTFPWRAVLTSRPVWATFISTITYTWALYVLLTSLPTYFSNVLGLDIKSSGVVSALPYLLLAVVQMLAGQVADFLRTRLRLTTTLVRKILDTTGHIVPGILIAIVGYVGCNSDAAVTLLILCIGITGLCSAGCLINFLDLCPKYAGIVFGISNTLGTISGIIGPMVTGIITKGNPSFYSWRIVFLVASGLYFSSSVVYMLFGEGKVQRWALDESEESDEKMEEMTERSKEKTDVERA